MREVDAEKISILMMQINSQINDSVAFARDKGTDAEFVEYRRKAGQVMGRVIDILNDLYRDHPGLKPEQVGGTYKVDLSIYKHRFYTWE
nr:hypothetical protein [uncultured Pseudomonas sp.]